MKKEYLTLITLILILSYNSLFSQEWDKLDSKRIDYICNEALNTYFDNEELDLSMHSHGSIDLNDNFIGINSNPIENDTILEYLRKQFLLDTLNSYLKINNKLKINSFNTQLNFVLKNFNEQEMYKFLKDEEKIICIIQFSNVFYYKGRYLIFTRAVFRPYGEVNEKRDFLFEYEFCNSIGMLRLLSCSRSYGFNFEAGKINYYKFTTKFNYPFSVCGKSIF